MCFFNGFLLVCQLLFFFFSFFVLILPIDFGCQVSIEHFYLMTTFPQFHVDLSFLGLQSAMV